MRSQLLLPIDLVLVEALEGNILAYEERRGKIGAWDPDAPTFDVTLSVMGLSQYMWTYVPEQCVLPLPEFLNYKVERYTVHRVRFRQED